MMNVIQGGKVNRKAAVEISDGARSQMADIVRTELLSVLQEPVELDTKALNRLARIIEAARPLLQVGVPARRRGGIYQGGYAPAFDVGMDDLEGDDGALSQASRAETFGSQAIRELVAQLPALVRPPASLTDLVTALNLAKDGGNTELAERIGKQIDARMGASEAPEVDFGKLFGPRAQKEAPTNGQSGNGIEVQE